jgi:hypothetical protein
MKLVEFPKQPDDRDNVAEFMVEVNKRIEESGATSVIVLMMNDEGHLGMSVFADYLESVGMLSLALREV